MADQCDICGGIFGCLWTCSICDEHVCSDPLCSTRDGDKFTCRRCVRKKKDEAEMGMADIDCSVCGHKMSEHTGDGESQQCTHPGCEVVYKAPCQLGPARRDDLADEIERQRSVIRSQNRNIAELSAEVERLKGSVQGTALAVFSNSEKAIDDLQAAAEYVADRIEREIKDRHSGAVAMFNEKEAQLLIDVLRGEIKP